MPDLTQAQRDALTKDEWDNACLLMGTLAIKHIDDKFIGDILESLAKSRIKSEARRKMLESLQWEAINDTMETTRYRCRGCGSWREYVGQSQCSPDCALDALAKEE